MDDDPHDPYDSHGPQALIEQLGMEPHPEGGWWCQTFRDGGHDRATRGELSSILYLLGEDETSRWHRVTDAVEIWFHHAGGPLELSMAPPEPGGVVVASLLGPDVVAGQRPQVVVPAGWWQAARPLGGWALVGCAVAPAFIDDAYHLAEPDWAP